MNYEFAYRVGFHPWEDAETQPEFNDTLASLVGREESGRPPYGPALDLGTGSGIWAVWLARRGWQVTAVEIVERALERARTRARDAGVDVRLVRGDVTDLDPAHVGSGFRLFLDTGTFHGLTAAQRAAMARGIIGIAAPAATMIVLGWERWHRGPLPRGTDRADIQGAFPGCETTDHGPTGFHAPPPIQLLMRPNEHWYRIRLG
ncbi:MAG: class I SAM-dependent methyltransferase [Solirubrobacteraceae bacterium]